MKTTLSADSPARATHSLPSTDLETRRLQPNETGHASGDDTRPIADGLPETSTSPFATEAVRIGRFLVLEPIGRGGMGKVYAVYDEQLDRKVAVKVTLGDEFSSNNDRARFLREAQALARLAHPHVVTVHEVGESNGRFFLAMEYIRGQSLRAWLRTAPDWTSVLDAFMQAGRGLVAAHDAGLVHRDLKPANIMRSDDGVVKVLDFGLARMAGEVTGGLVVPSDSGSHSALGPPSPLSSSLTRTGTIMGTPQYMAPEQSTSNTADARSDQYSFCVAVWEGLTGQRPFADLSSNTLLAVQLKGPPAWPESAPAVPQALVDALRRGLQPDPAERWPNMQALLDALSWNPRRGRNRWLVGLGFVGVFGLAGAALWTSLRVPDQRCTGAAAQLAGVWNEARAAELEATFAAFGTTYAATTWARTRTALDEYADDWIAMHTETCEATTIRGEQSDALMEMRMACLHRASTGLQAAVDTLAGADATVVRQAHRLTAGLPALSRCADIEALASDVEPPLPEEAEAVEAAEQQLARGRSLNQAGHYAEAREAVDAAKALLADTQYGPSQTEMALLEGQVLYSLAEYDASEIALLKGLRSAVQWRQWESQANAAIQLMLVVGIHQGSVSEGLRYLPLANPEWKAWSIHATLLGEQGKFVEAETKLRAAMARYNEEKGAEPLHTAHLHNSLAEVFNKQGRYDEAEVEFRTALEQRTEALGPEHPDTAEFHNNIAAVLVQQDKFDEADAEFRRAVSVFERSLGPDHPHTMMTRANIARNLMNRGKHGEAEAEFRITLSRLERSVGADHPSIATIRTNLATALYEQGKLEAAEAEYRTSLVMKEATFGPDHPNVAWTLHYLCVVLLAQDRPAEALPLAERAWATYQRGDTPPIARATVAFLLARALWKAAEPEHNPTRARQMADIALRSYRESGEADRESYAEIEQWLETHQAP